MAKSTGVSARGPGTAARRRGGPAAGRPGVYGNARSARPAGRRRKGIGTAVYRGEQTRCRFCREAVSYIDYKDIETLSKLLTSRGKIFSRKRSGNCAGCQRKVKKAIKRARFIALLPFTN